MVKREYIDIPRTFKVHRLEGLPPLAAFLWWRVSSLDPRLWPSFAAGLTLDGSDTRMKAFWDSCLKRRNLSGQQMRRIRQATSFLRKWKDGCDTSRLKAAALAQFVEIEESMTTCLTGEALALAQRLNKIMTRWLSGLNLETLPFQHGPGAVAESNDPDVQGKFHLLGEDAFLRYAFRGETFPGRTFIRCSRLIFVPKTFASLRSICAEPATLQFYQQGIMRRLYGFIRRHRYLRRHLPLDDQSVNAGKALLGSSVLDDPWTEESLCTMDLSAASDRLPWVVVKEVFRGTPLLRLLWATRSRSVELPTGEVIPLKKFAPMGSALCFPIQSLIYAAVVEDSTRSEFCPGSRSWSVFGDDIVVHESAYEQTATSLSLLGLKVNTHKSFRTDCLFKESCGTDAWDGEIITPLYLRSLSKNPENLVGLLDLAARMSRITVEGARSLYLWVLSCLPPYVADHVEIGPDAFHYFPTPLKEGKTKWSAAYQRRLHPAITLTVRERWELEEHWAYQDWLLRSRPDGRHKSPFSKDALDCRVQAVRVVWR